MGRASGPSKRLEPTRALASPLACAPAAQPPPRKPAVEETVKDQHRTSDGRTKTGLWEWAELHSSDYLLCPKCQRAVMFLDWLDQESGECPHCSTECFRERWEGEGDEAHRTYDLPGGRFFEETESDLLLMLCALSPKEGDPTSWDGESWFFGASPEEERRTQDLSFLIFFSTLSEVLIGRLLRRCLIRKGVDDALASRLLRPHSGWDRKTHFVETATGRKLSEWTADLDSKKGENFGKLLKLVTQAAEYRNRLVHAGQVDRIDINFVDELARNVPRLLLFTVEFHNSIADAETTAPSAATGTSAG